MPLRGNSLLPHHGGEVLAPFAQHPLVDVKPLAMLTQARGLLLLEGYVH